MVDPKLLSYVKNTFVAGFTSDQIKRKLLEAGWKEKDVDDAIGIALEGKSPTDELASKRASQLAVSSKQEGDASKFVKKQSDAKRYIDEAKVSLSEKRNENESNSSEPFKTVRGNNDMRSANRKKEAKRDMIASLMEAEAANINLERGDAAYSNNGANKKIFTKKLIINVAVCAGIVGLLVLIFKIVQFLIS